MRRVLNLPVMGGIGHLLLKFNHLPGPGHRF
jgi:hypothetical protein